MKKTLIAGALVIGLFVVACDDGAEATPEPTPAPAAATEMPVEPTPESVEDAVQE